MQNNIIWQKWMEICFKIFKSYSKKNIWCSFCGNGVHYCSQSWANYWLQSNL